MVSIAGRHNEAHSIQTAEIAAVFGGGRRENGRLDTTYGDDGSVDRRRPVNRSQTDCEQAQNLAGCRGEIAVEVSAGVGSGRGSTGRIQSRRVRIERDGVRLGTLPAIDENDRGRSNRQV